MNQFTSVAITAALVVPAIAHAEPWKYEDQKDEMTGKVIKSARVVSDNSLSLDSPYGGSNYGWIEVFRKSGEPVRVGFSIAKGQFMCSAYTSCPVLVRFDEEQPMKFTGAPPADHSSNYMFLLNTSGFLAKAAKAKTIRIQVNIFHNGAPPLSFTPGPLVFK